MARQVLPGVEMKKNCATCGKPFDAQRKTAKYCSGRCRVQAQRTTSEASVTPLQPAAQPADGDVEQAAREELVRYGRESSVGGQVVLALARRIDAGVGETGASFAALSKELRSAMAAAVAGAEAEADPVDEVRKQRERKRQAR